MQPEINFSRPKSCTDFKLNGESAINFRETIIAGELFIHENLCMGPKKISCYSV